MIIFKTKDYSPSKRVKTVQTWKETKKIKNIKTI